MKFGFQLFIGLIGLLLLLAVLAGINWGWRYFTADVRGIVGAEEQRKAANFRLQAYNRFFDMCAAIQGHEATLKAQRTALDMATSPGEKERLRANIAGITAQRARTIARYNADAAKSYTLAQFKANSLPYRIKPNQENTICE